MAQGSVKNYENPPTECIKEDFIATAPEAIALSSFDQRYPFRKFTSAFMVNAAAIHATSNNNINFLNESSNEALGEYISNIYRYLLKNGKHLNTDLMNYAYRSLIKCSLITAAFDKNILRITQSGVGMLIVFRNSFNGKKYGSFLPVFATYDHRVAKTLKKTNHSKISNHGMEHPFFPSFEIFENDIVLTVNTKLRSLVLLSHFIIIFNLVVSHALSADKFGIPSK
jgi:hypothetical protein